jgi:hypothetical protein
MIDGQGDPNTAPEYVAAVETLYALAYALKFKVKRGRAGVDYVVMPLEGLWWGAGLDWHAAGQRADWQWTMMIMQPEHVTAELFEQARAETHKKKPTLALDRVRFERYDEGPAAQIMHIGPTPSKGRPSRCCTRLSSSRAARCAASTTRSTWATRARPRRRSCAR